MRLKEKEVSIQLDSFFAKVVLPTNLITDNKQEDECKSCVPFFRRDLYLWISWLDVFFHLSRVMMM